MFWTGNLEPRTHSHDFFLGTTQQVPKAQLLIMLYTVPVQAQNLSLNLSAEVQRVVYKIAPPALKERGGKNQRRVFLFFVFKVFGALTVVQFHMYL